MRMPVLKLSRRAGKILLGIVLSLLILAALSAWLVPKAVHHILTRNVAEQLGRQVDVGDIRFNPFTLALSAQDLTIAHPETPPLLQIGKIDLRVAWRSIVLFAPVLDRISIDQPRLALVRQDAMLFNFSDIVDRLSAEPAVEPDPKTKGLPRFSLNNLSLTGGTISLEDRLTGRSQLIDDLTLGIPFISSLGYATKIDVQPAVHMRINGSPFELSGTARPFDAVPVSTLDVTLDNLALDQWADFWPLPLPVQIKSALLDSRLQVLFEQPPGDRPRIRIQGGLDLHQFDVVESSGAPLLAWDSLKIQDLAADLSARTLSIDSAVLEQAHVQVHRDARQLNWQRVAQGFAKLGDAAAETVAPETTESTSIATDTASLDTRATESVPTTATETGPTETATEPTPTPSEPPVWRMTINTFKIAAGDVQLRDDPSALDYPLSGLSADIQHIAWPQPADQPIQALLHMDNPADGSVLQIQAPIMLQPLSVQAHVQLDQLALTPFAATIRHFTPISVQDGRLNLAARADVTDALIQARDITLGLQQFAAHDDSVKPSVPLSIGSLTLAADRLALDAVPTQFTLQTDGLQKHGSLTLKGALVTQPLQLKTSVDLSKFDAATLAPYIASSLNATLRRVSLSARGDAEFTPALGKKPLQASWRGAVQVNNFDLQDRINQAAFLNWKHLGLNNMRVSMAGPKLGLGLGDIVLEDFYGNILLNSKARLNVMDILVDEGQAAGSITQDTQTRRSAAKAAAGRSAEPDISINSVKLKRGRMTFNDHFVRPNYRAELSSIDGTLSAVSSAKPTPAKVNVAGRVYGTAPFAVSGTVQPFARYLALDLKATAQGVDLPRFTMYSSKYVGYAIERGKLSVDLQYEIKDRALQASNKVLLNQLTFGKPSDSPDAIKLPVLLAVSLLKDSHGNIDINLPISGSLDDPQFSVGGIIVQVIVNTLTKAVTAPFKLLASAFGSDNDLSYIAFAPGSAELDDTAKSSIATLVKALNDRPALKMDITGRADPQSDEAGLRQAWMDDKIRAAKAKDMGGWGKKAPDPSTITLNAADRAKYLEDAYDDTKIEDKPRNAIGIAKSLPPEQMTDLLLAAAPLDKQSLTTLAEARAQAVYEQILATAQDLGNRVFIVAPKADSADTEDGGPATRVDFALQ